MGVFFSDGMSACVARVMLLLLLGSGPSWACGPSRSGQRVRTGRKLSPLVFNQQVPNAAENTLGASGLAEGRIVRNDSRFSELVPNYNPDIIFRDDEGTGVDRLMTTRLNEKVNTLAITVMNQWPGVKLRVTEAWEEDGFNNRDTLHYEGRAVDITTSDRERSKLGMLARLAVEAGFDWVNYESKSHIHCSVKSEKSHSKGGGCFTANTAVQTSDGRQVPLSELQVGQKILTVDTQTGQTQYSEVLLWLDRNPEEMRYFVEITTKGGRRLAVTPTHLLLMRRANETLAVYAGNVQQGDELLGLDSSGDGTLASDVVEFVGSRKQRGVYAPLTATGTLVVNGVGASCYAVINSQPVAHMAFAPYRLINNAGHAIRALLSSLTGSVARTAPAPQVGVHWYASTLYWVAQRVLPQGMLF